MGTESFEVFTSYARSDAEHAAAINAVLLEKQFTTFFDRQKLNPGLPWVWALEEAINAAKAVIVLVGPHGFGNTQHYEYEFAFLRAQAFYWSLVCVRRAAQGGGPTGRSILRLNARRRSV